MGDLRRSVEDIVAEINRGVTELNLSSDTTPSTLSISNIFTNHRQ